MTAPSTHAIIAVDNSSKGAVYKGLAIATDASRVTRLYATNFRAGTVEVFESTMFGPVTPAFTDPHLPSGLCAVQHRPYWLANKLGFGCEVSRDLCCSG
jgi:hypothetical protein